MSFLPVLDQQIISEAIAVVQGVADPTADPQRQRLLQSQLLDFQKTPQAWGLILPFLSHEDPGVQFFGAQTAQVKVLRDWVEIDSQITTQIKDWILSVTASCIQRGVNRVVIRKLFVVITALAFKLVPVKPISSAWSHWILSTVTLFSGYRVSTALILEFLTIVAEEIESASLVGSAKSLLIQSQLDSSDIATKAILESFDGVASIEPYQLTAAFKCLVAWTPRLNRDQLAPFIPRLISILILKTDQEDLYSASVDCLQEILSKSIFKEGEGAGILTEPLLWYLEAYGKNIAHEAVQNQSADGLPHSLCKLLTEIGDSCISYIATNLVSDSQVSAPSYISSTQPISKPRSALVQSFVRLIILFGGFPGYYSIDEDVSDMTLGFWYLFQEELWNTDFAFEETQNASVNSTKAIYSEAVQVLRNKLVWPGASSGVRWPKDQIDTFNVYRRDVGDILVNAYYILRDDMLSYLVLDVENRLLSAQQTQSWEEVEATLHCITSVQEAVKLERNPALERLFSTEVLGRLPNTGQDRIRRTVLGLIESYSSWFACLDADSPLLLAAMDYIASALPVPALCLSAATSLQRLCDANRKPLARHMTSFGSLHAGLHSIPDSEKGKVLQSIASVIQALPPAEQISPVQGIVTPVVTRLQEILSSTTLSSEDSQLQIVTQLHILAGVCKGLISSADPLLDFDDDVNEEEDLKFVNEARQQSSMVQLRSEIDSAIRLVAERWHGKAEIVDALKEMIKAITATTPTDVTLLSLPVNNMLALVCQSLAQQLSASWLSLAAILVARLETPHFGSSISNAPEATAVLSQALPSIVESSLKVLSQDASLRSNPDIVQDFFQCMVTVTKTSVMTFFTLPPILLERLILCANNALSLQETWSLQRVCAFLASLINRVSAAEHLQQQKEQLIAMFGHSILFTVLTGIAGVAPRSSIPQFVEVLTALLARAPAKSRLWAREILLSPNFASNKADQAAKERLVRALSGKKFSEAVQQFSLVARGLDGSTFGYGAVTDL